MTNPVVHGYADWQRQQPQAATIYVRDTKVNTGFTSYFPLFVGLSKSLGLNVSSTTGQVNVNVAYYSEAGLLNQVALEVIVVPGGGSFKGSIRISGPWCRINIAPQAGTASWSIFAYDAPQVGLDYDNFDANFLIQGSGTAVAASGSARIRATRTWPAEVIWVVTSTLTGWSAILEYVDSNGVDQPLDHMFQSVSGGRIAQSVFSPAAPLSILFINGTTAGTAYIFAYGRPALAQAA